MEPPSNETAGGDDVVSSSEEFGVPSSAQPPDSPPGLPVWPKPRRRRGLRRAAVPAAILGVLGVAAGSVFVVRALTATPAVDGPEAAVRRLFAAASKHDVLGVLNTLPPSERDLFSTRLDTMTKELARLTILREGFDLSAITGVNLSFARLRFRTDTVGAKIADVSVLEGTARYSVDLASIPLGKAVRDYLGRRVSRSIHGTRDLARDHIVLATVHEGRSWYVSVWYSLAEQGRRDARLAPPAPEKAVPALGAASAEDAVKEFLHAVAALDVRRLTSSRLRTRPPRSTSMPRSSSTKRRPRLGTRDVTTASASEACRSPAGAKGTATS